MSSITYISHKDFKYKANKLRNGTYGLLITQPGMYNLTENIFLNSQNSTCQIAILILGTDIILDSAGFTIFLNGPNQITIAFLGENIHIKDTIIRGNNKSFGVLRTELSRTCKIENMEVHNNLIGFGSFRKILNSVINEIKIRGIAHTLYNLKLFTDIDDIEDIETYRVDNLSEEILNMLYTDINFDEIALCTIVMEYIGTPTIDKECL
jgi:hypothetical protein